MKPSEKLKELGYVDDSELPIYKELDKRFIDKEELKDKINNIKKIYDDVEGRNIPGERYTYYEQLTYAKLHQLLDELLEE